MTTIRVSYPHYGSREPRPMKTEAIWRIAAEVRRQVLSRRPGGGWIHERRSIAPAGWWSTASASM